MKCEWKRIRVGDLGTIITGKTPPTKKAEYWGGNIHFITPKDLQGTKHVLQTDRFITGMGLESVRGCKLPSDAVCVSCIGNIGYVAMTRQTCISNQQINSIIANENYDPDFVYYLMKSLWPFFKNYEGQSTTLSILNKTQFSKIEIVTPDLPEQKKIASILSSLDDKIELNNKINETLYTQAKTIFDDCFINIDSLPDGWRRGNLLDIANFLNGLAMQKFRPQENEAGLSVLKIKELRQGSCDTSSERCSPSIKPEYIVKDGDVIFSWSGSLLVDIWCGGTCGLNQHLFKVTSDTYDKWFYYMWIAHHLDRFISVAADKATTMGHIKREELAKAEVLIPSKGDYKKVSALMTPMFELIIINRLEARKLAKLRDELLPKLMSGEIDVS